MTLLTFYNTSWKFNIFIAKSLFNIVIVGVGIIVGSLIAGWVAKWAGSGSEAGIDYRQLFSVPLWASVACLLILLVFYPGGRRRSQEV